MSMMITSADSRRQYLHTYGDALRGVQSRISKENNSIDSAVSLASMCLTLSEVNDIDTIPLYSRGLIVVLGDDADD
jgi:hypothetical protein